MFIYYTRIFIVALTILPTWWSFGAIIDAPTTKPSVPSLVDIAANKYVEGLLQQDPQEQATFLKTIPDEYKKNLKTAAIRKMRLNSPFTTQPMNHASTIDKIAMSSDGHYALTTTGRPYSTYLWNLITGESKQLEGTNNAAAGAIAISPNSKFALIGSMGPPAAFLYDIPSGKLIKELRGNERVNLVQFSPDSNYALTATTSGADENIYLWSIPAGNLLKKLVMPNGKIAMEFSPNSQFALTADAGTIYLWSIPLGEIIKTFKQPSSINLATFSPDGQTVLTGSLDGIIRLWDIKTGSIINEFKSLTGPIRSVADENRITTFSPNGQFALTYSIAGSVRILDLKTGTLKPLASLADGIYSLAISPDSNYGIVKYRNSARLFAIPSGELIQIKNIPPIPRMVFSPDGENLLIISDKTMQLFDISSIDDYKDTPLEQLLVKLQKRRDNIENINIQPTLPAAPAANIKPPVL